MILKACLILPLECICHESKSFVCFPPHCCAFSGRDNVAQIECSVYLLYE